MSDKQQCFYFVFCVYKEAHLLWQNDILSLIVIVLNVITLFFHIRINQIFHVNLFLARNTEDERRCLWSLTDDPIEKNRPS